MRTQKSSVKNSDVAENWTAKWLEPYAWSDVTNLNAHLCAAKSATHRATSDGHEPARVLWESARSRELTLQEALKVCRECHRLAPFCAFNGNTFVAIARGLIQPILQTLVQQSESMRAAAFRSVVGHFVAGTAGAKELEGAIREVS